MKVLSRESDSSARQTDIVEAFAQRVESASCASRLLAQARAMPQAHLPEAAQTLAALEFERAAALADVVAFALRYVSVLTPELVAAPSPAGSALARAANQLLDPLEAPR